MKLKAKPMGSIKALKDTLKKGGGSDSIQWIKNIPAEGITVRFLTEPEQWFGFDEYWSDESKAFIPMAEGEHLPDGARKSFRYLCVVLDTESDRVIPLKLPKTAANALILKYDKYDTMMDRDYELQKHGEGLDTTYEVTPEGPAKRNLAKYELLDLEEVLLAARRKALGEDDVVTGSADFATDDVDTDDDDDTADEVAEAPAEYDEDVLFPDGEFRTDYTLDELNLILKQEGLDDLADWWGCKVSAKSILDAQAAYGADDDSDADDDDESDEDEDIDDTDDSDDDEDDEEDDEEDDDDVAEYDEDELRAMSIRELRVIANDLSIAHRGKSKDDLIDAIIEAAEA